METFLPLPPILDPLSLPAAPQLAEWHDQTLPSECLPGHAFLRELTLQPNAPHTLPACLIKFIQVSGLQRNCLLSLPAGPLAQELKAPG